MFAQIEHVSTQKKVMKVTSAPNHDPNQGSKVTTTAMWRYHLMGTKSFV